MTSYRDIERILDHWFAERRRRSPIASSMRSRTGSGVSHSDPRGCLLEGHPHVGNIKPLAAVAAVIVIAVVGFALLRPSSGSGVGTSPTTSPTASPTPSPKPTNTPRPAGMVVQQKPISFTVTLPQNWVNNGWFAAPSQGRRRPRASP